MIQLRLSLLACLCALLPACSSESPDPEAIAEPATAEPAAPVRSADPFGGLVGANSGQERNTVLPRDPFFSENLYPGAEVLDVKMVLVQLVVMTTTTDAIEKVNAYYGERFSAAESSTSEDRGNFKRTTAEGAQYDIAVRSRPGNLVQIVMQRR